MYVYHLKNIYNFAKNLTTEDNSTAKSALKEGLILKTYIIKPFCGQIRLTEWQCNV